LRKEFAIDGLIERATLYVTGLGLYEVHVNGRRVSDGLLAPEYTKYVRRVQYRALDVTKLLLPYEPNDVVTELAAHKATNPDFNITNVHFFPLGGIKTNATWAINNGGASTRPVNPT
jgi:hypothetical protein